MKNLILLFLIAYLLTGKINSQPPTTLQVKGYVKSSDSSVTNFDPTISAYKDGNFNSNPVKKSTGAVYSLDLRVGMYVKIRYEAKEHDSNESPELLYIFGNNPINRPYIFLKKIEERRSYYDSNEKKNNKIDKIIEDAKNGDIRIAAYNLMLIKAILRDDPEITEKLNNAEQEFKEIYRRRELFQINPEIVLKVFEKTILINKLLITSEANLSEFLNIIKDNTYSKDIRQDILNVFQTINLNTEIKSEVLVYLREQAKDPKSDLFAPSLEVLLNISSEENDRKLVLDGIDQKESFERLIASIQAVEKAKSKQVSKIVINNIINVAKDINNDIIIRLAAIKTLHKFASLENDSNSIRNLISLIEDKENPEIIRLNATESLLGVNLSGNEVQTLERALIKDTSSKIKLLANGIEKINLKNVNNKIQP